MINLAPTSYKESLRYARRNTLLWHWLLGFLIMITLASSTIILGKMYLQRETSRYVVLNEETEGQLQADNIEETLNQIEGVSNNLKLIIQVLSNRVIFSKLITQVGSVMPPGAVLADIEIGEVEGGIDLTAKSTDYNTATQVQVNLQDPSNKLFDEVDLVSVECNSESVIYPCTTIMRALFTKDNPYLFVNIKNSEEAN
ncbi:hypothetical protein KC950_01825 [Candidatus Saccharibacteria bacterium]|nr:hypothetical protein [Candidatus Saccharibacteria bacterium]